MLNRKYPLHGIHLQVKRIAIAALVVPTTRSAEASTLSICPHIGGFAAHAVASAARKTRQKTAKLASEIRRAIEGGGDSLSYCGLRVRRRAEKRRTAETIEVIQPTTPQQSGTKPQTETVPVIVPITTAATSRAYLSLGDDNILP